MSGEIAKMSSSKSLIEFPPAVRSDDCVANAAVGHGRANCTEHFTADVTRPHSVSPWDLVLAVPFTLVNDVTVTGRPGAGANRRRDRATLLLTGPYGALTL